MGTQGTAPRVTMRGITKRFGSVTALDNVDFTAAGGTIHAMLGENGAGKSTLMRVLAGLTTADAGTVTVGGSSLPGGSPTAAQAAGIAMVHQHFALVPAFTVAENLALGAPPAERSRDPLRAAHGALERARQLGWNLDPSARIADLSVGTQQRVEIARALATDATTVIFDEPTAVLSEPEVNDLFGVLRNLKARGATVLLIAHKLSEILSIADRVTVLRRGALVAETDTATTSAEQLAEWMIGAVPVQPADERAESDGAPVLVVDGWTVLDDRRVSAVRSVSFSVRRGEILGIGGVDGNGQAELAEALAGVRNPTSGSATWKGGRFSPPDSPRCGYIPQDRRRAGLAPRLPVSDNLLLNVRRSRDLTRGPFLRVGAMRAFVNAQLAANDIRASGPDTPAATLSGGNQQKIVTARALAGKPDLIVAVNPTRGLDVAAAAFVHARLLEARAAGAAIVVVSTDLDEVAALADRALIMASGALAEWRMQTAGRAELGLLLGATPPRSC